MPQVRIHLDNLLTPSRSMKASDPYEGYRLGKAAVTAERFPQWGKTLDEFTAKVNRHFIRLGLQLLNEQKRVQYLTRDEQTLRVKFVGEFTTVSADELAEQLWDCIPVSAVNWEGEFQGKSFRLDVDRMDRLVTLAAAYAVETWNPRWELENRRRARLGGQHSSRGKSVSLEAVAARVSDVEHLPEHRWATAIADVLTASGQKASARTVKRRLDELKAVSEDDGNAALGSTAEEERAPSVQLNLVPTAADELACVDLRLDPLGHENLAPLGDGRVEDRDDVLHEMTVAHAADATNVFDRFYAEFQAWQDDWNRRAHGEVDVRDQMTTLADELLAG